MTVDTIESLRHQRYLLTEALGKVLVAYGLVRADAEMTGPMLLNAAADAVAAMEHERSVGRNQRGQVRRLPVITRAMVRAARNTVFVFGDNMTGTGYRGQAKSMRGEPNTIGVPTKWRPGMREADFFHDADWTGDVRHAVMGAFAKMGEALDAGKDVVIPADGLGTGLAQLPSRAPRIHKIIVDAIAALEARA